MNAELVVIGTLLLVGISVLLISLLPLRWKSLTALIVITLNAIITTIPAVKALGGSEFLYHFNGGLSFGIIRLHIDPLSAWFIIIINITLFNGALYGSGYMKAYQSGKNDISLHWIMFVIFHLSMLWVCMLQNGFAFLVAWEIMTLSSLLLVMFDHSKAKTLQAGLNYMVQMHLGIAFLTIAFIRVFIARQTIDFTGIISYLQNSNDYWTILLFFLGFGIKAGFIPLHTWLPYAHPAAPSHVSGVMSGVIVKMGIYGILRIFIHINNHLLEIGILLVILSAITALYGILNASVHRDFKKMLAFCTSENIGIIGMGIGIALIGKANGNPWVSMLGFSAALLHVLNHSLYKSLLFFASGNIYLQTHTRNMELLGGLIRYMPITAISFLIGSLAIGGMPPFNGFISKFLIYSGFIDMLKQNNLAMSALMIISIGILSMAGGVSMLTFTKAFGTIFLGEPRTEYAHKPVEAHWTMQLPIILITILMLFIGLFPQRIFQSLTIVIQSCGFTTIDLATSKTAHILTMAGRSSVILLGIIALFWFIRKVFIRKETMDLQPTWGCGYVAPRPSMQYTGKSFSKSLAKLFGFITIENKKFKELKTVSIFPSPRTYTSYYLEFFETRILDPLIKQFLRIFNFFTFIHNGKIQLYVLYGLLFMIILLVLTLIKVL
jgi:hydrogenase-4 component B